MKKRYKPPIWWGCVWERGPDCVPESVLDLLSGYHQQGYEIWVELGLQTSNDETLKRINRGHDFACYAETAERIQKRGFKLCTHLILGLPGEQQSDWLHTLKQVVETGTQGIKLHPLHIVQGFNHGKGLASGAVECNRSAKLHRGRLQADHPHAETDCLSPGICTRTQANPACTGLV